MFSVATAKLIAICVLGLFGGTVVAWAVILIRRMPFTPLQTLLYGFNYLMARILWRVQIDGQLPIPSDQGAVIVCNHRSPVDTSFIAVTVLRAVHWMVAKEYCQQPGLARILRLCEVIPTNRAGIDTASTMTAIRLAQEGELVGLFPEGRINTTEEVLLPGRLGAAMIALRARVPVVPCYVSGTPYDGTMWGFFLMPATVRLRIGRAIDLSPYYDRENDRQLQRELTKRFLSEIAKLAEKPDFQPQLAGRFHPDLRSADLPRAGQSRSVI